MKKFASKVQRDFLETLIDIRKCLSGFENMLYFTHKNDFFKMNSDGKRTTIFVKQKNITALKDMCYSFYIFDTLRFYDRNISTNCLIIIIKM